MGGEKVENLGENICGRGVGKMLGAVIYGSSPFGGRTACVLTGYGMRALSHFHLSTLNSQLSTLISHLYSLQEGVFIHDFNAEFLRLFEF